jgi:uncharacterized OsmC-like protein
VKQGTPSPVEFVAFAVVYCENIHVEFTVKGVALHTKSFAGT